MAQLRLREVQRALSTGNADVLYNIKQNTVMPIKETIDLLAKAPIMQVIKLMSSSSEK